MIWAQIWSQVAEISWASNPGPGSSPGDHRSPY